MQLVTYSDPDGVTFGAVQNDAIHELGRRLGVSSLRAALAAGIRLAPATRPDCRLDEVTLLPPIPDAARILCVGLNYPTHVAETARDLPPQPSLFLRDLASVVGHRQPLVRPRVSEQFDFEGELAAVIGRSARHVAPEQALACVAGYTCFNDGSLRDFQKHSVTAGKNFESSGACGPWLVTADEIPDPSALELVTRLNGVEVQRTGTGQMIYSLPAIIAYISRFITLQPGDVIATGTPAGVGARRTPPLWMRPGDVVEVTISSVGTLSNPVVAES